MTQKSQAGFGFEFNPQACETCPGHCCCGESGYVWISMLEAQDLAEHLGLNAFDFYERYTYRQDGRISLKETFIDEEFACVFFDTTQKKCSVYAHRPKQCRTYPFWPWNSDRIEALKLECPGIVV